MSFWIGVAVVCVLLVVALVVYRNRNAKRRAAEDAVSKAEYDREVAPIKGWILAAEAAAGSPEQLADLDYPSYIWDGQLDGSDIDWWHRLIAARQHYDKARALVAARASVDERVKKLSPDATADERREALYRLLRFMRDDSGSVEALRQEYEDSLPQWQAEFENLARQWFTETVEAARQDRAVFMDVLFPFMTRRDYESSESQVNYAKLGVKLDYPSDWNDMVATYFANPGLDHFRWSSVDAELGRVRRRAADAVRTGSLTDAKLVLAFCDSGGAEAYTRAIGAVRLAQLADLVLQVEEDRGLIPMLQG